MKNDGCQGCFIGGSICYLKGKLRSNKVKCPCKLCLVKITCQNKCEDRRSIYRIVSDNENRKERLHKMRLDEYEHCR